jgi:hypothetical protein
MVKRILCAFLCIGLFPLALKAQEGVVNYINILYRIQFENDFYFLAQEAGTYLWDGYKGPFPDKNFWSYSLENFLGQGEHIAQILRCPEDKDPFDEAVAKNIPLFVDILVTGEVERPYVKLSYTIRDLYADLNSVEKNLEEYIPSQEHLLSYFWLPLASDVEAITKRIVRPPLEINGPPGTLVYGFTDEPLIIPDSGMMSFYIPMPKTYERSMVHKKYAIRNGFFLADEEHTQLDLPRQKFYAFSVDIGLSQFRYPNLWLSWTFKSFGWFLSAGIEQQLYGISLSDNEEAPYTSFNSRPLVIPGIAGGYLFRAPAYQPKLYVRGGFSFCVEYEIPRLDEFSPFSVDFALGYDWETPVKIRLFAEAGISFRYLHPDFTGSLALGKENSGFVQVLTGDVGILELPRIRVGFKVPVY